MSDPAETAVFPPTGTPAEIGGYEIVAELTGEQCYLTLAPGGRRVVLKILEPDVIVRGQLHPSVRDRLGRVREIAHFGVANLHGAERDGGRAYLIWEYVEGEPLQTWCESAALSPRDLLLLARELVLVVEALHARGIVHGAIHGRNVIVDAAGRMKLTHVSPYLYTDPAVDGAAVAELLREIAERSGVTPSPFESGLLDIAAEPTADTLRALGARVIALIEQRPTETRPDEEIRADQHRRGRSLLGGVAVLLLGVVMAYGLRRYVNHQTSAVPVPPEAPPSASSL